MRRIEFQKTDKPPAAIQPVDPQWAAFLTTAKRESAAEMERTRKIKRLPMSILLESGKAIGPIQVQADKRILTFTPHNHSWLELGELREGKTIALVEESTQGRKKVGGARITSLSNKKVTGIGSYKGSANGNIFLLEDEGSHSASYVQALAAGPTAWPPKIPPKWKERKTPMDAATAPEGLAAIKGPPGTGKTTLLGEAAAKLASQGKTVLITSSSNTPLEKAIEVAANTLKEQGYDAKVGYKPRSSEELKPPLTNLGVQQLDPASLKNPELWAENRIVGVNLISLAKSSALISQADFLFVDEAGMVTGHAMAPVADCGKEIVLFGDEDQLEPIYAGQHDNKLDSAISALAFVKTRFPERIVVLNQNHRSNRKSVEFTNSIHYPTIKLEAVGNAEAHHEPNTITIGNKEITLIGEGTHFLEILHSGRRKYCPEEIQVSVSILNALLGKKVTEGEKSRALTMKDFGFLAPHRHQVEMAQRTFQERFGESPACGTIHKFQGQTFAITIFSLTASSKEYIEETADFLTAETLWNVATSRQITACYILGNTTSLKEAIPPKLSGLQGKSRVEKTLETIRVV